MSLKDKIKIIPRRLLSDERGWFLKVIDGKEEHLPSMTGEVYITCGTPGHAKGNHYHIIGNEWFTLIKGEAELRMRDVSDGDNLAIRLSGDEPVTVYVPSGVAHVFENKSETQDFILVAYADTLYDPGDTIQLEL